jgi:hypothetical protein
MLRFGGDVTYRKVAPGTYNSTTGAIVETVTETGVKGILEDVNLREINELIQAGDKRLIVAALDLNGTTPSTFDRVVISNIVHQIIRVQTIEQNNEPITYELILRV